MKDFIEVQEKETGLKVFFKVERLLSVSEDGYGSAFIEFLIDCNGESIGFNTRESYEQVTQLIKDFA